MIAEPPLLESFPAKHEPNASEPDHDHDHGAALHLLPHWMQDRWAVLTVAVLNALRLLAWHEPAIKV